jgi:mRNA interferase RelE/StbE
VNYSIFFLPRGARKFTTLPKSDFERVRRAIDGLAENHRLLNCQKLKGRDGWGIRVGNYRIAYDIDDAARAVTVVNVGHRREVYR